MALIVERHDGKTNKFVLSSGVVYAFMTPLVVLVVYFTGGQIVTPLNRYLPEVRQATPNPEDLSNYDDAKLRSWLAELDANMAVYGKRDGHPKTLPEMQTKIDRINWQRRELIKELNLRGIATP